MTDGRVLMIDWLIFAFCPVREYFTQIGSHHILWRVAKIRPKININHLLFKNTLFQTIKQRSLKIFTICCPHLPCHLIFFYPRPNEIVFYNSVTCVQPNGYNLFVAIQLYQPCNTWDFVVHVVYEISCCLEAKNEPIKFRPTRSLQPAYLHSYLSQISKLHW